MICLGIDTALGACSAALADGDRLLARDFQPMATGHAEALAPMVQRVVAEARLAMADIGRLAVTTGPGTFTGQRIGLAFARGLSLALGVPCIGLTTLEAMAAATQAESPGQSCLVVSDARRGEVYGQVFDADGSAAEGPRLMPVDEARRLAQTVQRVAGSAAAMVGEPSQVSAISQPDAAWVARLGLRPAEPQGAPSPLYLRAPDAKLPGPLKPLPLPRATRPG